MMRREDRNGMNTGMAYDSYSVPSHEKDKTNIIVIDPKDEIEHNMNYSVCYTPKDFSIMLDDNTLEFASPVEDSQGKRGSAQIKILKDGTLVKDGKERFSVDERTVSWSDEIDKFVIEKFRNTQDFADQLLTTLAVSIIFGVSKNQIYKFVKQGKLKPAIKKQGGFWFVKEDIIRYLMGKIQQLQLTVKSVEEYKE